jgi:hypothetical protein
MSFLLWNLITNNLKTLFHLCLKKISLHLSTFNYYFRYHEKNPQIIFLKQKFGMPFGIKYFTNFHSREGITKRNILIITDRNQVC